MKCLHNRPKYLKQLDQRKQEHTAYTLGAMEWEVPSIEALMQSPLAKFIHFAAYNIKYNGLLDSLVCELTHPLMLQAKTAANKEDNPNLWQAMNGPFAEEYWKAACVEVNTLKDMEA